MSDTAVPDTTGRLKKATSTDDERLSVARKRLDTAMSAWSETRESEVDDLRFAAGSPDNNWQWPQYALSTRTMSGDQTTARPTLTINKLPQHIKQVTNDQLQNLPSVDVIPVDDGADEDIAEIFEGIVRHIELDSDAEIAYGQASENQVTYGEGYIRILTDYEDEKSFDQRILICNIRNSFSVYIDPMIKRPCGEDMMWAFITEDLTHEEYEFQFPDAQPISSLQAMGAGDQGPNAWIGEKTIRIAEYFYVDKTREKLWLFKNGDTAFEDDPEFAVLKAHTGEPVKSRMSERRSIKWCKINGYEVLEESIWPGKYIPIVRVVGNEFEVEGQVYLSGIVRNAKDPQRMINYWTSQEAEMLALAPKAPFIGYTGQFDGYESDWKTANVQNHPYLQANPVVDEASGQLLPLPQRAQPPMVQSGLIEARRGADQDLKDATGQYNASLGQPSNERSGKAILARQHEGDVSTYHYGNNLKRAVRMVGRMLVDLIPKIYDRPGRVAQVLGEDGKSKMVTLDSSQQNAVTELKDAQTQQTIAKIYNPNVGKYNVAAVTGPGYSTKRQEALAAMSQILESNPQLWTVFGDVAVEQMDWPGHQKIAKRIAKTIPPQIMNDTDENPALQQAQQQIQELQQHLQQATQMLQQAHNSIEARDVAVKEQKVKIDWYDAVTRRIAAEANPAPMTEQQVQDIAMGVADAAMQNGGVSGMMGAADQGAQQGQEGVDQTKLMQEASKHVLQANQHDHEARMAQFQAQQAAQQPAPEGQQ